MYQVQDNDAGLFPKAEFVSQEPTMSRTTGACILYLRLSWLLKLNLICISHSLILMDDSVGMCVLATVKLGSHQNESV